MVWRTCIPREYVRLVWHMHVAPPYHFLSVQYHECSSTPHAGSKCCTAGVTIMYLPLALMATTMMTFVPICFGGRLFFTHFGVWYNLACLHGRHVNAGLVLQGTSSLRDILISKTPSCSCCTPLSDPNPHVRCHTRSGVVHGTWLEHTFDGLPAVFLLAPRTRVHNRVGTPAMPSYVLHTHGPSVRSSSERLPLCRPPLESRF
jgi:hypothetical protein